MASCSDAMTTGALHLSQSDCLKPRLNRGFDWPEFRERLVPLVHQPTPPSSSPAVGESSFVTCHISKLTIPLFRVPLFLSVILLLPTQLYLPILYSFLAITGLF